MEVKFIIIYPWKLTSAVYHDQYHLEKYAPYCSVEVWDVSKVIDKKYSESIEVERYVNDSVFIFENIFEFYRNVAKLKRQSRTKRIVLLNQIFDINIKGIILHLLLKPLLNNCETMSFEMLNGGSLLSISENKGWQKYLHGLVDNIGFDSILPTAKKYLKTLVLVIFKHFQYRAITHQFVSGKDWEHIAESTKNNNNSKMTPVYGHSSDYSNFLDYESDSDKRPTENKNNTTIYLDRPGPAFNSDYLFLGLKEFTTVEKWYPALEKFFTLIEKYTKTSVQIAGHYKSPKLKSGSLFGDRDIIHGETMLLISNCELVVAITSTAISYAVAFRKPIMLIYSNEMKNDVAKMREIFNLSKVLGLTPINIDEPPSSLQPYLTVNEDKYKCYEQRCLTSNRSKETNYNIILKEFIHS
jgi:hypothetical protein